MIEFNSLEELYERVMPVLSYKCRKLELLGNNITEFELFSYLSDDFSKTKGLTLFDVVDKIMNFETF